MEETLFHDHPEVVDADLADYFGSIPHAELMRSLARRIVDRRVLHLIKMWLECAVEETDDQGPEDTHDGGQGQRSRHPAGFSDLTTAGESIYAPVRVGMEEARAGGDALALAS